MSLKLQKQEKLFFTVKVKFLPGDQETICTIQNCSNTIYFFVALHVSDVSISGLYPLCWYMPPWYQTTEFTSWPWNCCVEVVWLWQVRANKGVSLMYEISYFLCLVGSDLYLYERLSKIVNELVAELLAKLQCGPLNWSHLVTLFNFLLFFCIFLITKVNF